MGDDLVDGVGVLDAAGVFIAEEKTFFEFDIPIFVVFKNFSFIKYTNANILCVIRPFHSIGENADNVKAF